MRISALALAVLVASIGACGAKSAPAPSGGDGSSGPQPGANDCIKTGCSGTLCADPGKDMVTTCEYKPEYACYQSATCGKQADGACGWTQTPDLTACLANPPPMAEGSGAPVM